MAGMLTGIRIVEMGHMVAVPSAGAMLADWGGEVIKLEPLSGDMARRIPHSLGVGTIIQYEGGQVHWWFQQMNRGKKSLAVDLKREQGRAIVYKLVETADVFVSNYQVGALQRLKMDYQTLSLINPRLVYAVLTGYGTAGPDKDERGFDYSAAWARSGMQHLIGEPGTPPPPQRPGQYDNVAGSHVVAGVLAALLGRERTGVGQELEFSLYHSAAWSLNIDLTAALFGRPLPKDDRTRVPNPLWNTYRTKDDRWLQLVILEPDRHWPAFCTAIERPELEHDPRFRDFAARRAYCRELIPLIEEAMARRTMVEWERILREHDCLYGRIQTPVEVTEDPQALANGFFPEVSHPIAGPIKLVASPAKLGGAPAPVHGAAPEVGQHTEEILLALGYSSDEIVAFQRREVVR